MNLKNALTGSYLSGKRNVYKIKAPNGRHFVFVNKNSLGKLLNRASANNIVLLNEMISKVHPWIARNKLERKNGAEPNHVKNNPSWARFYNNWTRRNNYEFRKWNRNHGMIKPRGPYGGPIKLKNVNHHTLTNKNLRNLRVHRRQNTKNAEEFARAQTARRAAQNAERKKYIYQVKYPLPQDQRHMWISFFNANMQPQHVTENMIRNGRLEPVTGPHNITHIKRRVYAYFSAANPNYNLSRITITPYRKR